MVNHAVVLEYGILLAVGCFAGFLFALKTLENARGALAILRHVFLGTGSSMLATWLAYELIKEYFHLNLGLSLALSAGVGYLGAEVAVKFFLEYLGSKFRRDSS
ncbi:holin [Helicobacter labacensis]|uniref:holin n=1 Tax=Helicobacter labacensis TaxID=2316079 RepID=UPI000EADD559|nr:holin [Helicobacter labacensis]